MKEVPQELIAFLESHPQLARLFKIDVNDLNKTSLGAIGDLALWLMNFFGSHKVTVLYFSSDGHAFLTQEQATHQAFWHEDKTVTEVTQAEVEEVLAEYMDYATAAEYGDPAVTPDPSGAPGTKPPKPPKPPKAPKVTKAATEPAK